MVYATHWIDLAAQFQEDLKDVDTELPDWANVDLNPLDGPTDSFVYGTKAVLKHLVEHRSSYDYDEFNRQIGVILENESEWIREEFTAAGFAVDDDVVKSEYDQNRRDFASLIAYLDEEKIQIPTRGFKAMADLDEDGFMREQLGPYGRRYAQSVVDDISIDRVTSGRVPVPDDLGFDFSRTANMTPERAREITRGYDAERMAERQAQIRRDVERDLDAITGHIPEDGMELNNPDPAFSSGVPVPAVPEMSDAEREAEALEVHQYQMTPESIEELLNEYKQKSRNDFDRSRDDFDPTF